MGFTVAAKINNDKWIFRTSLRRTQSCSYEVHIPNPEQEKRRASALVDELLVEIYNSAHNGTTDYYSTSGKSQRSAWIEVVDLHRKGILYRNYFNAHSKKESFKNNNLINNILQLKASNNFSPTDLRIIIYL